MSKTNTVTINYNFAGPAAVNSNPPAITPKQKQKIPETLDEV